MPLHLFCKLGTVDRFVETIATRRSVNHQIISQREGQLMLIWFHGAVTASLGLYNWTNLTIPAFANLLHICDVLVSSFRLYLSFEHHILTFFAMSWKLSSTGNLETAGRRQADKAYPGS